MILNVTCVCCLRVKVNYLSKLYFKNFFIFYEIILFFQVFNSHILVIICEKNNPTQISFQKKIKYYLKAVSILNFSIH